MFWSIHTDELPVNSLQIQLSVKLIISFAFVRCERTSPVYFALRNCFTQVKQSKWPWLGLFGLDNRSKKAWSILGKWRAAWCSWRAAWCSWRATWCSWGAASCSWRATWCSWRATWCSWGAAWRGAMLETARWNTAECIVMYAVTRRSWIDEVK